MSGYYVYHRGTGTLIAADDEVFVFSDEDFTDEEKEALDSGDTSSADGAGANLMTLIAFFEKAHDRKKSKKKGKARE